MTARKQKHTRTDRIARPVGRLWPNTHGHALEFGRPVWPEHKFGQARACISDPGGLLHQPLLRQVLEGFLRVDVALVVLALFVSLGTELELLAAFQHLLQRQPARRAGRVRGGQGNSRPRQGGGHAAHASSMDVTPWKNLNKSGAARNSPSRSRVGGHAAQNGVGYAPTPRHLRPWVCRHSLKWRSNARGP